MRKAAYIFAIIVTVFCSIAIIPMAWMIPMTIAIKKSIGDGQDHVALGVFSLLFLGIITGILMLIPESK